LSAEAPRRKKWKAKPWLALICGLLAALAIHRWRLKSFQSGAASPKPGVDWFLILRLPELQFDQIGSAEGKGRLGQWLDALDGAGYAPMFLSEAVARSSSGSPLPEKAVVLLYMPASRQTVEGVFPLLARHHFSATLLMPQEGVDTDSMRLLSRHSLAELHEQGFFDLGFYGASSMTFTLRPSRRSAAPQAEMPLAWDPLADRNILSSASEPRVLNRLNINLAWTGPQLLQRLAAEVPIRSTARLTAERLLHRYWGIMAEADAPFDLQADEDYRGATVTWRGTRGRKNLRVEISAEEVKDELWAYLRYDHAAESGWRVGFTPDHIFVEQIAGEDMDRILTVPWSRPRGGPLSATITLTGARLSVAAAGAPERTAELSGDATTKQALFGISVYSKIHALAMAKAVRIVAAPLPE
jgi:hypothetical protein